MTSVIITVYNRPAMLKACLRALELNKRRVDEIIVSDDGSDRTAVDEMKAFFYDYSIPIQYVHQEESGFRAAAARNNAIRHASGEYLISLDCDILLMPDAVEAHLRNAAPGCFLAANRAFLDENLSRTALIQRLSPEILEDLWKHSDKSHLKQVVRQFERNRLLRMLKLTRRHKPKIIGCHFSLYKKDVEKINGFDENYVGWGLEDDDFGMRLHKAGIKGKSIVREARAMHLHHSEESSKPRKISDSRNMSYFQRPNVPARCVRGLV